MDGSGRFISAVLSRCAVRVGGRCRSVGSFCRSFTALLGRYAVLLWLRGAGRLSVLSRGPRRARGRYAFYCRVAPRERAGCRFCRVARGGLALVSSKREKE